MSNQFKVGDWVKVVETIRIRGGYVYPNTIGKIKSVDDDSVVLNFGGETHMTNVGNIVPHTRRDTSKSQNSKIIKMGSRKPGKVTAVTNELIAAYGFCFQSNNATFQRLLSNNETKQAFYEKVGITGSQEVGWMLMKWLPNGEIRMQPAGEIISLDSL